MGWVVNTHPTGWYGNGWVWKITVTVTENMLAVGWGIPLSSFAAGVDGGIDFFRYDPGDVTVSGFNGSAFGNDAGLYTGAGKWIHSYGDLGNLLAGTYTIVAYVYNDNGSPPSGPAPSWQASTDYGVWLDITGVAVGATLEPAKGVRNGVGIYVVKIDDATPNYQRLIYGYNATQGLFEIGAIDNPILSFLPPDQVFAIELGGGDLDGRSYVPTSGYRFDALPAEVFILPRYGNHDALLIDTFDQMVPAPSRPGLLYAFPSDGGGELDRFLAGDIPRYIDRVGSFPGAFPLGDTSGHFDITYGLVDKDDATIVYGISQLGLWKANIQTNAVTSLASFTANFKAVYVLDDFHGGRIIGQRANGDIVTSLAGANFGFVHTWGRDGSGLKTEAYLGGAKDGEYAPVGFALLDDETIVFGWSIFGRSISTLDTDRAGYPRDRVQHFYTAPLVPTYEATSYEAMPDSERLFPNGTPGRWTTMGRLGVARDPFLIDGAVPPHNGVGRTILSNVKTWENNQYVASLMDFPVLPGDVVTFSVWLMPEDTGAGSYGSWSQLDISNRYGNNNTFYSLGSLTGIPGDDTELTPGDWTRIQVTGTVPGTFPPGVDPGTPAGFFGPTAVVRPGVPTSAFLRFEHPGNGKLWISDLSLNINGHRDVGIQHVGQLAWPEPADADDLHYFIAENGWPAVLNPTSLAGGLDRSGVNFN